MERVLRTDKLLSESTLGKLPANAEPATVRQAIEVYVQRGNQQSFENCPADVVVAYRHHLEAWQEFGGVIADLPSNFWTGMAMGFANFVLRKEGDGGVGRIEAKHQQALNRVRSTWHETERMAAKYGVAVVK